VLAAWGCGNQTDFDEASAPASRDGGTAALLTILQPEPVGATCQFAGQRTLVGLDTNTNGVLEPTEVLNATVVCNGAGVTLPAEGCPSRETRQLPPLEASWHDSLEVIGPGFIALKGSGEAQRASYYARKTRVRLDKQGCLSTGEELRVQAYASSLAGTPSSVIGDLCIGPSALAATATTQVRFSVNLDANSTAPSSTWNGSSPASTSSFPSSVTVYDSLGNGHQLTVYFRRTDLAHWEWHAVVDGSEIAGATPGLPVERASGTLRFSTDGALEVELEGTSSSWQFVGAAPTQAIQFDFGSSLHGDRGNGLDGTTNFASPSTTQNVEQDGYAAGSLSGMHVSDLGVVLGAYTNGQSRAMAQIPIASFPLADALVRACNDLWVATPASGEATLGLPGTFDRGSFLPIVD
jgi:flagellar hook protein FlgE